LDIIIFGDTVEVMLISYKVWK